MTEKAEKSGQDYIKELYDLLELYLVKKAPALPTGAKEGIVKFGPWIILIMIIMTLPMILALFGLGTLIMPLSYLGGINAGMGYTVALVLSGVSLVLEAIALPGLFRRELKAWNLVYYATLVSAVQSAVSFNIVGLILGTAISLYILFQVRSYYK